MQDVVSKSPEIKVVGIIKPSESTVSQPTMGGVYYTKAMEEYVTSKTGEFSNCKRTKIKSKYQYFYTGRICFRSKDEHIKLLQMSR